MGDFGDTVRQLSTPISISNTYSDYDISIFNPSIIKYDYGYVLAARFITKNMGREIFLAKADRNFSIDETSVRIFSKSLTFAHGLEVSSHSSSWFADPRLYRLDEKLYLFWNDGMPSSGWNSQFLAQVDPETLETGPARRVRRRNGQTMHEKNWMLFSDGTEWRAVYSVNPHRILKLYRETDRELIFSDGWTTYPEFKDVEARLGHIRGGAQPVQMGDHFISIAHSCQRQNDDLIYKAVAYKFSARAPYSILAAPLAPLDVPTANLDLSSPWNSRARSVVYPVGAVDEASSWVLSYGVGDSKSLVARLPIEEIYGSMSNRKSLEGLSLLASRARELIRLLKHFLVVMLKG